MPGRHGAPAALVPVVVLLACLVWARTGLAVGLHPILGTANGYEQPDQQQEQQQEGMQQLQQDQEQQAQSALLRLFQETNGPQWQVFRAPYSASLDIVPWDAGTPICSWTGVACCESSPLTLAPCNGSSSVIMLDLKGFGLSGQLPPEISGLPDLQALNLEDNPRLRGPLPDSLEQLDQLLWLSIKNTSLTGCAGSPQATSKPITGCTLPRALEWAPSGLEPVVFSAPDGDNLLCPAPLLRSFRTYTRAMAPAVKEAITHPLPQPPLPGAILASPGFSLFFGCLCADGGVPPVLANGGTSGGAGSWECPSGDAEGGGGGGGDDTGLVAAVVVVTVVLALLLLGIGGYLLRNIRPGAQSRSQQQAELSRKRSKVPGTPGVALQAGQGLVVSGDVLVTWVCTDVADSTWLWEWDAGVMDQAIAMHNTTIRELLEEQGGHEIRNEGDSFVMSFHDASDAVRFCLQVQDGLLHLPWPPKLLSVPQTAFVYMGDVSDDPSSKGQGPPIMAGLRVRIGINTGVPDDVFLHNVTEHVDYRGNEYDLAGQICDIADGGQILMGPKTYQRWNKCCTDTPDGTNHHRTSFEGPLNTEDPRFQRTSIMGRFASQTGRTRSLAMKSIQPRIPQQRSSSGRIPKMREPEDLSPGASGMDADRQSRTYFSTLQHSNSGTEVFSDGCRFPIDLPASATGPPLSWQNSKNFPSSRLPEPICESCTQEPTTSHTHLQLSSTLPGPTSAHLSQPLQYSRLPEPFDQPPTAPHTHQQFSRTLASPVHEPWKRAEMLPSQHAPPLALPPQCLYQQQYINPLWQQHQPCIPPLWQEPQPQPLFLQLFLQQQHLSDRGSRPICEQTSGPLCESLTRTSISPTHSSHSRSNSSSRAMQPQQQHLQSNSRPGPVCESLTRTSISPTHNRQAPGTAVQGAEGCASSAAAIGSHEAGVTVAAAAAGPKQLGGSPTHPSATALGGVCPEMRDASAHVFPIDGQRNAAPLRLFEQQHSGRMPSSLQGSPLAADTSSFKHWEVLQRMGSSGRLDHMSFSGVKMEEEEDGGGIIHYIDAPKRLEMDKAHLNMVTADADPDRSSLSSRLRKMTSKVSWTWQGTKHKVHRFFTHARMQKEAAAIFFGADDEGEGQAGRGLWGNSLQSPNASAQASQGLIIDMGYYEWRYMGSMMLSGRQPSVHNPDMQERGSFIHLVQVVSNALAPRVLLFRWPLAITAQWEKLASGFFDAPGASSLSFPNMFDLGSTGEFRKSRPKVVIAFASLEGYSQICATDLEVAQDVLSSYNACVRETLAICEGYECKEINGSFMAAFADGCKAMEWALTLHLALAAASIAEEVLDRCKIPSHTWQAVAQQLVKGVHARVGIYGGTIDRVTPNHKTGRADYFGQPVNRAARLMSAASAGQTLCEQRFMQEVLKEWANRNASKVESHKTADLAAEVTPRQQGVLDEAVASNTPNHAHPVLQQQLNQEQEQEAQQAHEQQGLQQERQQQDVLAAEAQQQQQQQQERKHKHQPLVRPGSISQPQQAAPAVSPSSSPFQATPPSPPVRPNLQSLSTQAAPWRAQVPSRLVIQRKPWDPEQQQQQDAPAKSSGNNVQGSQRSLHVERRPSFLRRGSMTAPHTYAQLQQQQELQAPRRQSYTGLEQAAHRLSRTPKHKPSFLRRASMAASPTQAQRQQQTPAKQAQLQNVLSLRQASLQVPAQRCVSMSGKPRLPREDPVAHPKQQDKELQLQSRKPSTCPALHLCSNSLHPTNAVHCAEPSESVPEASNAAPSNHHPLHHALSSPNSSRLTPSSVARASSADPPLSHPAHHHLQQQQQPTTRSDTTIQSIGLLPTSPPPQPPSASEPLPLHLSHPASLHAPGTPGCLRQQACLEPGEHTHVEPSIPRVLDGSNRVSRGSKASRGSSQCPSSPFSQRQAQTPTSDVKANLQRTSIELACGPGSYIHSSAPQQHPPPSTAATTTCLSDADTDTHTHPPRASIELTSGRASSHCPSVVLARQPSPHLMAAHVLEGETDSQDPRTSRNSSHCRSCSTAGHCSAPQHADHDLDHSLGAAEDHLSVFDRLSGGRRLGGPDRASRRLANGEGARGGGGQRNSRLRSVKGGPSLDQSHGVMARPTEHNGGHAGLSRQGSFERAKSWMSAKLDRPSRTASPVGEPLVARISRASRKSKRQNSIRAEPAEPSLHRQHDSEGEVDPLHHDEGPRLNAEVFELKCTDGANEDITMFKYRNEAGGPSHNAARQHHAHSSQQLPVVSVPTPTEVAKVPVDVSAVALGVYRLKGVTELVHVVRVMPVSLERPAIHHRSQLEGKTTCVSYNPTQLGSATIWLPEVRQLNCCASTALPPSLNVNATSLYADTMLPAHIPVTAPEGEPGFGPDPGFWSPAGGRRSLPLESIGGGELRPSGPLSMDRLGSDSKAWGFYRYSLPTHQLTAPAFFPPIHPSAPVSQAQAITSTTNPLYSSVSLSHAATGQVDSLSRAQSLDLRHAADLDTAAAGAQTSVLQHAGGAMGGPQLTEGMPAGASGGKSGSMIALRSPPALHTGFVLQKHPSAVNMHMPLSTPVVLDQHTPHSTAHHVSSLAHHAHSSATSIDPPHVHSSAANVGTLHAHSSAASLSLVHEQSSAASIIPLATSAVVSTELVGMCDLEAAGQPHTSEPSRSAFQGYDVESGPLQPIREDRS
mmetsp:Transcript_22804/g.59590  ORF Transcript_22804/g.59590 Transcript_22804/m.59590 type:complete len:2664 (-) Transcript_22804:127-8118(-)